MDIVSAIVPKLDKNIALETLLSIAETSTPWDRLRMLRLSAEATPEQEYLPYSSVL
jgi:hypothetical protein